MANVKQGPWHGADPVRARKPRWRGAGLLAFALLIAAAGQPRPQVLAQRATPPATRPTPTPRPDLDASMMATWRPEYTSWQPLPGDETPITLAAEPGGQGLWMATGATVARLFDGVWSTPEQPTDADHIYAMTVTDRSVWGVGWSGGAWRRGSSGWTDVASGTVGDLYAMAHGSDGLVWAAGFDYETASGVIVRWSEDAAGVDPAATTLWSGDALVALQLYSVAVDSTGGTWAGGCRINGWEEEAWQPVILRLDPDGSWSEHALPLSTGCVYDLAFAAEGPGWAAAGTDILRYDNAAWVAEGLVPPSADPDAQPPVPEGVEWVRVAASGSRLGNDGPLHGAWAVAGVPTWRGYINGQTPWRFDGSGWSPAAVDYRGLPAAGRDVETEIEPRSFMALAGDGDRAWSVNRTTTGAGDAAMAFATIMELDEDADAAVLFHPLLLQPISVAITENPEGESRVFVAGRHGSTPIDRSGDVGWLSDPAFRFVPARRTMQPTRSHIDLAAADRGWQLRTAGPFTNSVAAAHRWDGERWRELATPRGLRQLRTLPDGGAWGRVAQPGGKRYTGQLVAWQADGWQPVPGAPEPAEATPLCDRIGKNISAVAWARQDCDVPRAPFDAVTLRGNGTRDKPAVTVGWLGGADHRMYRWDGTDFQAAGQPLAGPVLDLQLAPQGGGWAIMHDEQADPPTDRLMRLQGERNWIAVDQVVRRHPQLRFNVVSVEWQELAMIDAREVWLRGRIFAPRLGRGDRVLVHLRGNTVEVFPLACSVVGMAAARVPGGSDLWLVGGVDPEGCRMDRFPIPVYEQGDAVAGNRERLSRLRIRDVAGRVALPWLGR